MVCSVAVTPDPGRVHVFALTEHGWGFYCVLLFILAAQSSVGQAANVIAFLRRVYAGNASAARAAR